MPIPARIQPERFASTSFQISAIGTCNRKTNSWRFASRVPMEERSLASPPIYCGAQPVFAVHLAQSLGSYREEGVDDRMNHHPGLEVAESAAAATRGSGSG